MAGSTLALFLSLAFVAVVDNSSRHQHQLLQRQQQQQQQQQTEGCHSYVLREMEARCSGRPWSAMTTPDATLYNDDEIAYLQAICKCFQGPSTHRLSGKMASKDDDKMFDSSEEKANKPPGPSPEEVQNEGKDCLHQLGTECNENRLRANEAEDISSEEQQTCDEEQPPLSEKLRANEAEDISSEEQQTCDEEQPPLSEKVEADNSQVHEVEHSPLSEELRANEAEDISSEEQQTCDEDSHLEDSDISSSALSSDEDDEFDIPSTLCRILKRQNISNVEESMRETLNPDDVAVILKGAKLSHECTIVVQPQMNRSMIVTSNQTRKIGDNRYLVMLPYVIDQKSVTLKFVIENNNSIILKNFEEQQLDGFCDAVIRYLTDQQILSQFSTWKLSRKMTKSIRLAESFDINSLKALNEESISLVQVGDQEFGCFRIDQHSPVRVLISPKGKVTIEYKTHNDITEDDYKTISLINGLIVSRYDHARAQLKEALAEIDFISSYDIEYASYMQSMIYQDKVPDCLVGLAMILRLMLKYKKIPIEVAKEHSGRKLNIRSSLQHLSQKVRSEPCFDLFLSLIEEALFLQVLLRKHIFQNVLLEVGFPSEILEEHGLLLHDLNNSA